MRNSRTTSLIWTWHVETPHERADLAILNALEARQGSFLDPMESILDPMESVCPSLPTRSQLKKLFELGQITLDGKVAKANSKLKSGMQVRVTFPPPIPTELVPEERPIDLLYEDEHLLVINKPQGLTVHPSATQMQGTLVHALLHHIQDLSGIGGVLRPGIVHRIDKDTSGALVITKTDRAHQKLSEIFSRHEIERCYWALCFGSPEIRERNGIHKIESLIGRNPTDRKKMSMKVSTGRNAVTYIKKRKEFGLPNKRSFASWLEVTLETGRTHQIRVHLTGINHSILGDPVYGKPSEGQPKWQALPQEIRTIVGELPGQALHARILGFDHPISGKRLRFEAEPPAIFQRLVAALELYDRQAKALTER